MFDNGVNIEGLWWGCGLGRVSDRDHRLVIELRP